LDLTEQEHLESTVRSLRSHCKIDTPNVWTFEELLNKALEYFNEELERRESDYRLEEAIELYSLRIGKKKNGKPDFDYPSKLRADPIEIDLDQKIVDMEFDNFAIVYELEAIVSRL